MLSLHKNSLLYALIKEVAEEVLCDNKMRLLELFSGTHSVGKVAKKMGYEVVSVDRDINAKCPFGSDYVSDKHIKTDIMTWDYKKDYKPGDFDVITASPVCLWWSHLRLCWIGRKCKSIHPTDIITRKHIDDDIERYGKPMVDKVFEILDYFKPKYWWIENPQTGRMKEYIDHPDFYDIDYCKYSDWGYKKRTRIWTNIKGFKPKICKKDCDNIVISEGKKQHKNVLANGYEIIDGKKVVCNTKEKREERRLHNTEKKKLAKKHCKDVDQHCNRLQRYRVPFKLIEELLHHST
jgi:hypothetical protein